MTQRKFVSGDEWLYYKIYSGIQTSDILLIDSITPLVRELKKKSLIESWFFVRYRDPDPHIRFRLRLINLDDVGRVISTCNKYIRPYLERNQVWKIQTDTYVRELERYGEGTICNVEEIFFYESELLLDILNFTRSESDRFQYVLISVDSFLKTFDFCIHERAKFHQVNFLAYKERLGLEFGNIRVKANEYQRKKIISKNNKSIDGKILHHSKIQNRIKKRNERISSAVKEIIFQSQNSNSDINLFELIRSIIHMFFNKAFKDQQVMYELLGYYLLMKRAYTELNLNEKG